MIQLNPNGVSCFYWDGRAGKAEIQCGGFFWRDVHVHEHRLGYVERHVVFRHGVLQGVDAYFSNSVDLIKIRRSSA